MAYLHLSLVGNESHGMWESFTDVNSRFNASITYLSSGIFGSGARPQQILSLLQLMSCQLRSYDLLLHYRATMTPHRKQTPTRDQCLDLATHF